MIFQVSDCTKFQNFRGSTPDPAGELTVLPQTPKLVGRGLAAPPIETHPRSRPFGFRASAGPKLCPPPCEGKNFAPSKQIWIDATVQKCVLHFSSRLCHYNSLFEEHVNDCWTTKYSIYGAQQRTAAPLTKIWLVGPQRIECWASLILNTESPTILAWCSPVL